MANETSGYGSLRLTAPTATAYDQSPGEQLVLKGLDANNLGAMYGLLLNQRAGGMAAQDAYRRDLGAVNAQQYGLAQAKLQADELQNLRGTAVEMGKLGADLTNLGPLAPLFRSMVLGGQTDQLRRDATSARAFNDTMSGLNSGSQAGVNLTPGQSVTMDPAELRRLTAVTGDPRSITEQRIQAGATVSAAGMRAASDNAPRVKITEGPLEGDRRVETTGTDYGRVLDTSNRAVAAQGWRRGSAPTGPAAGAGGGSSIRTPQQAIAAGREQGLSAVFEQGGRWFGRNSQGATVPVR